MRPFDINEGPIIPLPTVMSVEVHYKTIRNTNLKVSSDLGPL